MSELCSAPTSALGAVLASEAGMAVGSSEQPTSVKLIEAAAKAQRVNLDKVKIPSFKIDS